MKTSQEVAEFFDNTNIRLDQVIFLAGLIACVDADEQLTDILEGEDDKDVKRLLGCTQATLRKRGIINEDLGRFLLSQGRLGYIVNVSTPVPSYRADGSNSFGYSWGHRYTRWFYTEDLTSDEFFHDIKSWKDGLHRQAKKKAAHSKS